LLKREQKLYQSEEYLFCIELQEVMGVVSGRLSYRPEKFAVFCRWLLILPVYSGSKPNFPLFTGSSNCIYDRKWVLEIGNRNQEIENRIKDQGLKCC